MRSNLDLAFAALFLVLVVLVDARHKHLPNTVTSNLSEHHRSHPAVLYEHVGKLEVIPKQNGTLRHKNRSDEDQHASSYRCNCDVPINQKNYQRVLTQLESQLKQSAAGKAYVSIPSSSGKEEVLDDVVVFVCNKLPNAVLATSADNMRSNLDLVKDHCGQSGGGSITTGDATNGYLALGFMKYTPGMDWCKEALVSSKSRC